MADNPVFLAGCQLLSGLQPGECNYLELYDTDFWSYGRVTKKPEQKLSHPLYRVFMGPEKPGKSWKKTMGPEKSWKFASLKE